MNKKKLMALCLIVCLLAIAVVGGSLAYFTDTDAATNTMVIGNVDIEQTELQRSTDGTKLEYFEDGKKLFPAVIKGNLVKETFEDQASGYAAMDLWTDSINNEVDKIVTVTNTGSEKAYVRTILAFETVRSYTPNSSTEFVDLHKEYFGVNGVYDYLDRYVTIDGVEYILAVCLYEDALESGATTAPSLKQFFLAPTADNETSTWFGNEYTILALSQAAQTEGFEDVDNDGTAADEALDAAFGDLNTIPAETIVGWFSAK